MAKKKESDGVWPFNRCRRCAGLITKLEVMRAFKEDGVACGCGSGMFVPSNLKWYEGIYPRVWLVYIYALLGWLPPCPEPSVVTPEVQPETVRKVDGLIEGTVFEEEDE